MHQQSRFRTTTGLGLKACTASISAHPLRNGYRAAALSLLLYLSALLSPLHAQSIKSLQQQKAETQERIANTNQLLEQASHDQQVNTMRLELLNSQLQSQTQLLATIGVEIQLTQSEVTKKRQDIERRRQELDTLKSQYARFLRAIQFKGRRENVIFSILASQDLAQMYRRLRFYQEYTRYRQGQHDTILHHQAKLEVEYKQLKQHQDTLLSLQSQYNQAKSTLEAQQQAHTAEITRLALRERELKQQLATDKEAIERINREIKRLLEEEAAQNKKMRKDALYAESGRYFSQQKGKLPWPVKGGVITRGYGEESSKLFKGVKTTSQGVDLSVPKEATVVCIAPGIVSKIARIAGANTVIIVRHGDYLTLYSNLATVSVRHGENVDTGTPLGTIQVDKTEQCSRLHFEIWKGFKSENPRKWLKP